MARKLPQIITQDEFEKLYQHIQNMEKDASKKQVRRLKQYRLCMLLGFEAGMRISEIVGLKKLYSRCCDVPVTYSSERVIEDGIKKTRRLYICSKCKKSLDLIKETHRTSKEDWEIDPLTKESIESASIRINQAKGKKDRVTLRPKRFNQDALNLLPIKLKRRSLQNFFTEMTKKILRKQMHFHTLRHGFGSHLAGMGRPLHEIQMLMGHSRLDTTGIYLHANPKQAIEGARDVF